MNSRGLAEEFASHLGQALEMMTGERPSITTQVVAGAAPEPASLFWEQPFNVPGLTAWLGGVEEAWTGLGGELLSAAGIEDYDAPTAKSTFVETLNQAFSGLARELTSLIKKELTAGAGAESGEPPTDQTWCTLDIQTSSANKHTFLVAFSPEFTKVLTAGEGTAAASEKKDVATDRAVIPSAENSKTLELLLDVELPVSVSFGRAQLSLKDVIKLTTGSIVELNRTVGEPVEVIVNNCVIARGEVVVIEGNFGVRIQQVISKQERLRTLY